MDIDKLLGKQARQTTTVHLPTRGEVKVRALYETEKVSLYENWFYTKKIEVIESRKKFLRTRMIAISVFDDDPETPCLPAGTEKTIFENWTSGEVAAVYQACVDFGGEDEEALEAELGNSPSQQNGDTTTG